MHAAFTTMAVSVFLTTNVHVLLDNNFFNSVLFCLDSVVGINGIVEMFIVDRTRMDPMFAQCETGDAFLRALAWAADTSIEKVR